MENTPKLSDFLSSNSTGGDKPGQARQARGKTTPLTAEQISTILSEEGADHIKPVVLGIYGQESSGGTNAVTSTDGARGGMQVMPATFQRFAKPGESLDNPVDNMRAGVRYIKALATQFGNDPAKIATGYFSGEGNVNTGQGNAWKQDRADGNGKRVSSYVGDLVARITGSASAQAAEAPRSAAPDLGKAPKWADVQAKPEFQALSPEKQAEAKGAYFDYWIAPHAGASAAKYREQFLASKAEAPGLLDRAWEGAKGLASQAVDALTPAPGLLESAKVQPMGSAAPSLAPVDPKVRAQFNAQWDAATPEQRTAMAQRPGWTGQLARERAGLFDNPAAVLTETGDRFDPRAEKRAQRLVQGGEDARFAQAAAQAGARAGAMPGKEVAALGGTAEVSSYDFETAQAFDPSGQANGLNRILGRGMGKGALGISKAITGYGEFLSDVYGLDQAGAMAKDASQWARGKEQAIGERGDFMGRNMEGAISSIAQQLPLLVAGVAGANQAIPLAGMALQSFGQEYSDGRKAGQDVAQATARAAVFAAFEVIGEKFGLKANMDALKAAARGMPSDKIAGFLWESLKKDIPGEMLTTTGQFITDKFAPAGVGLNPNATGEDYIKQLADTIAQTLMQGGAMAGGTTGVGAGVRYLKERGPSDGVLEGQAAGARDIALAAWEQRGPAVGLRSTPQPVNPVVAEADQIVREMAEAAGLPLETVLPTTPEPDVAPQAQAEAPGEQTADDEVLAFAEARYDQLRSKRDGTINTMESGGGLIDVETPGQPLSPSESQELDALQAAGADVAALRNLYGVDQPGAVDLADAEAQAEREAMQADDTPVPPQQDDDIPGFDAPAAAEPTEFGVFDRMQPGEATADLYGKAFDALKAGKDTISGVNDPILGRARAAFDAGLIKTADDIRNFENNGYPAPAPAPAPTAPKTEKEAKQRKALERIAKGTAYFGQEAKAQEWIKANGLADTHMASQASANRWDVVAKEAPAREQDQAAAAAPTAPQAPQETADPRGAGQAGAGEQGGGVSRAGSGDGVQADGVKARDAGLFGEVSETTRNSLLAMRDNKNVPALLPLKTLPNGNVMYKAPADDFIDIGNGFKVRGYSQGASVVQDIQLPNGMVLTRTMRPDGSVIEQAEGDYEQIVAGKGFAEAEKLIAEFFAGRNERANGSAPAIAVQAEGVSEDTPAARWTRMPTAERAALALRIGIKPPYAGNMAERAWDRIDPVLHERLAKAMDKKEAPGTQHHTDAHAKAADRLQMLLGHIAGERDSPVGRARSNIRSAIEELRKPRTVVSVQGLLETARDALYQSKRVPQSDVVQEVIDELYGEQAPEAGTAKEGAGASQPMPAATDDLGAMFDEVLAEEVAKDEATPPLPKAGDILFDQYGTDYRIEDARIGFVRLTKNPGKLSEQNVQMDTASFDRLVKENAEFIADAKAQSKPKTEKEAKAKLFVELRSKLGPLADRAFDAGDGKLSGRIRGFTTGMKDTDSNLSRSWVDGVVADFTKMVERLEKKTAPKTEKQSKAQRAAAEVKALADYFTPGNVVRSYSGFDRIVSFTPASGTESWSVTVHAVEKQGDKWADVPRETDRVHRTPPEARALKAGPVGRVEAKAQRTAEKSKLEELTGVEDGKVGMKLAAGQVVRTTFGMLTTPFPKINTETARKAGNTIKLVDGWLMGNALAVAKARGDEFNAGWMRQALNNPSQSDKDSAEEYLFGEMPPVAPSILKPLGSAATNTAAALGNAIDGLGALFGGTPGKLQSGMGFDEDTYAKAKPLFQAAIANLGDAKADLKEAMRQIVRMVMDKFGAQAAQNMKPYVVRFVEEISTKEAVAQPAEKVENPGKQTEEADAVRQEQVPERRGQEDRPDGLDGDGDRQPLDAGLARDGEQADRAGRVPARPAKPGNAGAPGVGRDAGNAPGAARDRAGDGPVAGPAEPDDHVIDADADGIGKGGLGKKFKDNVAAIKTLKAIEAEGRQATADERKTLAKYVGWGAMKGPFDPENKAWAKQHAELKELLTEAEFRAARASTLDAHYTSPVAVGAIYDVLARLGFKGGRLLEPSVGSGNFFGLMPTAMRNGSNLHGVELDSLTSRLVAAIYPKAKIAKATGFQNFDIPSEFFDVVVGNPPFGNTPVTDQARSPYSGFSVHNYFLAKGIDKLRPGGLMAVVVSHNFLDAQDGRARKWIGERANLVAAVRLPNTAFKENAGTEVVTDILIFQKREGGAAANGIADDLAPWQDTVEQINVNPKSGESAAHKVNQLFAARPDLVLGKPSAGGTMYSANEYTVEATQDIKEGLAGWVKSLPSDIYENIDRTQDMAKVDATVPDGVKVGSFFLDAQGKVQRRGDDVMGNKTTLPWEAKSETAISRMKGMIALRDTLRTQMRLERSVDATNAEIEANRGVLNKLYDDFLKKFKHLNSTTNRSIFLDDTEAHLIQALEFDYDKGISKAMAEKEGIEPKDASAKKADIFQRRVAFPPQDYMTVTTAKDALLASLNFRGRIDPGYMTEVYGKDLPAIVKELGDVVFDDPQAGLVMSDEYLAGDVKTKLAEAKAAAQDDPKFRRNVEALSAVIPKDKTPSEISVSLGAAFVPPEFYTQFAKHITGVGLTASYLKATGQWLLAFASGADPALNTGKFGTGRLSAQQLMELAMLGRGAVVKETYKNADGTTTTVVLEKETEAAREKQAAIKQEWQKWLWDQPERAERIAQIYNDTMNRIVVRKYDGGHLTFPGMSPAIALLDHQKNGVWRGLQSFQVLYDHVVGAGKTFEMATLAMEMRRLGIARKPLFVVPNHLTLQWRSEFTRLYPGSNILAATPEDFSKENRERMFAKIITGDWDAVVVGHSTLKKFGLPAETEKAVLQEQIDEIAEAIEAMKRQRGDRRIVSDMERIRKTLESKMESKLAAIGKRSKMVTFDELGVDAMFIDEMHEFKNLTYNSTMDRSSGMGNPAGSAKAFDMFVKARWLFDTFGTKTPFITATGTPVSNSLVEMFNMQRYMQYPTLKEQGLHVFDAWAKQFGSVESVYEVAPSGSGYRQSTRFAKFTNLPALMNLYNSFADTITLDDLKAQEEARGKRFPVPKVQGGRPTLVVAKRSPAQAARMGVPKAQLDESGRVKFAADLDAEITVAMDDKGEKWVAKVGDNHLGTFETEQDARMKVVEAGLTPVVSVDPESILGRFADLRRLTKDTKGKVNALSLTGEANKIGLDYRLVDPGAADFAGSKINLAVANMMETYKKWAADKGTQLVFCDLSIPLSARANYSSKARRLYVRDQAGVLAMKRGTLHAATGHESLPFFVVQRGEKEAKRFDVFDAASGVMVASDLRTKPDAVEAAASILANEDNRQAWIEKRERAGEISQEAVDEFNNDNDVEVEDPTGFYLRDDIAGMSGSAKFSVYDDIKAKLIARGVPEREIAFIHDYSTPVAKAKLFKAVNAGEVRFLLGSTPKMGAGTNVQELLVGLHHIDAPWRPSDLEQREGRIIRRGNKLYERDPDGFEVFIGRYATEQTYDTRRWQILEHKARGIEQLRNFDGTLNEIEDIEGEAATAADMKAAASGDPLILEETKLRNEAKRLERLQAAHQDEVVSMTRRARDYQNFVDVRGPQELENLAGLAAKAAKHPLDEEGFSPVQVEGANLAKDKEAAHKALQSAFERVRNHMTDRVMVEFRGLSFFLQANIDSVALQTPSGQGGYWLATEAFSPSGMVQRMKNYIDRLDAHRDDLAVEIGTAREQARGMREQAKQPFAHEDDLAAAREEHKKVQRALMAKGPSVPESQKTMVRDAMDTQKLRLRELGFDDVLDEFLGSDRAIKFNTQDDQDGYTSGNEKAQVHPQQRTERAARNMRRFQDGVLYDLQRDGRSYPSDVAYYVPVEVPQAREIREIASAFNTEIQWFELKEGLTEDQRRVFGKYAGANLGNVQYLNAATKERPHLAILGHELAHQMARDNPDLYDEFVEAVNAYIKPGAFAKFVTLPVAEKAASPREEFSGEVLSDLFMERDFWISLGERRAGLLEKVASMVQRLVDMLMAKVGYTKRSAPYLTDFRKVMEIAEDIMVRYAATKAEDKKGKISFAKQDDAFSNWFGDSKVVDKDGKPLVVYHGTTSDVRAFSTEFFGEGHGASDWGDGFYFTNNPKAANTYAEGEGGNVMPVYLALRNPANRAVMMSPEVQDAMDDDMGFTNVADVLEGLGYDGIEIDHKGGDKEFIVFDPSQIKSAIGNSGAFDPANDDIRFMVQDDDPSHQGLVRRVQNNLIQFFGNRKDSLKTFGLFDRTLATQYHKALKDKHFGKVFALANAMQNHVSLASIRPAELAPGVLPRVDDVKSAARTLVKGNRSAKPVEAAANAIFAGTLAGSNVLGGRVWTEAQLRGQFGLDDTGVALYKQARAAIDASLDEVAAAEAFALAQSVVPKSMRRDVIDHPQAAEGLLDREINNQIKMAKMALRAAKKADDQQRVAEMEALVAAYVETQRNVEKVFVTAKNLKKAGYAPLMRFGQFHVTVQEIDPSTGNLLRDEDGKPLTVYFSRFETEAEARFARDQQLAKYADDDGIRVTSGKTSQKGHELYGGISPETIALFADALGAEPVMRKYIEDALSDRSALKRRLTREGIAGYSEDLPRVLSNFITSNGRHAAQRYYLRELNQAVKYIPHDKGDVKDEAIELKKFILNPDDPAAAVSSVMFAWFLGGSVAAALINLSQPFMMTGPYLAQHGVKNASTAMAKALPMAMGKKEIKDTALRAALKRASQEGIVDAQEIFHLYSVGAQGVAAKLAGVLTAMPGVSKTIKAGSEAGRARINAFMTLWGSMFSLAEGFNRKLTFIAAWDIAKGKGLDDQQAYAFSVRAVNETQGVYNKVSRPNWARSQAGRIVMTFKQFSIMYVELLSRMVKHGGPEGRRAALIMLAVLMLASGEEGLPFMQDLNDLIDTIGQLLGYDTNAVRSKRRLAHEILGKEAGDLFLYGVSAHLPVDVANRLGLGNLIPGTSLFKASDETQRGRQLTEVLGPAAGLGGQVGDAWDAAVEGNTGKALQNLAPKAVKDVLAAAEMASKGYATDPRGNKVVDVGLSDAAGKAIGFNPTKVAQEHRKTMPVQQDIALQKSTETSIVGQWARAIVDGDDKAAAKAEKRLDDWNQKNPGTPIVIKPSQLRDRVRQMNTDKDDRVFKRAPKEMRGGLDLVDD